MPRPECCCSGVWGTVCADSFSDNVAKVVCRQLGYSTWNAIALSNVFNNVFDGRDGSRNIWLDAVSCHGSEWRLSDCSYNWENNDCGHIQDIGVECSKLSSCTCYRAYCFFGEDELKPK